MLIQVCSDQYTSVSTGVVLLKNKMVFILTCKRYNDRCKDVVAVVLPSDPPINNMQLGSGSHSDATSHHNRPMRTNVVVDYGSLESRCAYGLLLMSVYWITEALPLAVTAMLPILVFPVLGVAPSKALSKHYMKDIHFLLIGGLIVAIAIEKCNIHKRFALRLLMLFGVSPKRFLFAFVLGTAFMSMWISNTAATTMMLPIARSLLDRLFTIERHVKSTQNNESEALVMQTSPTNDVSPLDNKRNSGATDIELQADVSYSCDDVTTTTKSKSDEESTRLDTPADFSKLDERSKKLAKALSLCICYGANCGGIATLTGTPTNLITKAYADNLVDGNSGLTFLSWMVFCFPVSVVALVFVWLWLQLVYLGPRETFCCGQQNDNRLRANEEITKLIRMEHKKLGSMSFAEYVVLVHLILMVLLWFTRNPGFIPGYADLFPKGYISDAVPSVLGAISLFIFPIRWPAYLSFRNRGPNSPVPCETPSIIQWSDVSSNLPWGIIMLLGGGFALAEACQISGLSEVIADKLSIIQTLGPQVACLVVVTMTCILTEVTSNTVLVTIFMPILAQLATSMRIHPLYFMLPAGVSASFAFMLPVATPPNAVVFSYGDIKVMDMVSGLHY
ncbi:solute carrier family 13 member 2-like [Gigantopelta aegis]|uniref:solute carrier family 13 member 2-like n=1 Tax=Gigantopelta aegis TaxID=1735272 RepID=UPI001B88BCBE|nr:solute carrier family 13 member 2-like [Gigantopelta aegis]